MTTDRRAALVALKDAVEAGTLPDHDADLVKLPREWWEHVVFANSGSTDAALALLGAVLPGVQWAIYSRPPGVVASIIADDPSGDLTEFNEFAATPARALLLAILAALIEQEAQP